MVADPSLDNIDWIVSVQTMEMPMQPPYDPWKEPFFVRSPTLVFLVDAEIPPLSDIHPEPVLSDLVQNTLFDLAIHQAPLVHRIDHLLHEIGLDTLHALTYVM